MRGQASLEWVGLVLLVALVFAGAVAVVPRFDGRSFAGALVHAMVCAAKGGCDDGDRGLALAYGQRDAALVRSHTPGLVYEPGVYALPVDFRSCRSHSCSDAPDRRDLDVHTTTRGGLPATVFTRLQRRAGETFIHYWFYYPDSTTTVAGAKRAHAWVAGPTGRAFAGAIPHELARRVPYPGEHRDDWESYQVRIDARGRAWSRASAHRGYTSCKQSACAGRWLPETGWTRVSRGSHAGHVPWQVERRWDTRDGRLEVVPRRPELPGLDTRERTTTAAGVRLVPLEKVDHGAYERLGPGISPPWEKAIYNDPLDSGTG